MSIAIPTYRREQVLIDTLESVFALCPPADEILVLDQTEAHSAPVESALKELARSGRIRHLRLSSPSIPAAMNAALKAAAGDVVLFLDDDVLAEPRLTSAHLSAHRENGAAVVAGRVIQPWQEGLDFSKEIKFHFAGIKSAWIQEFMGGNFSIRRETALKLGGFDENFVGAAYHFEAEFAFRLRRAGLTIYYEPEACIHHRKVSSGGTRTFGEHLRTAAPAHSVGAYYFVLRTWRCEGSTRALLFRPICAIATRHHLRRPWFIPLTVLAELRGLFWALALACRGPRYGFPVDPGLQTCTQC